ISWKRVSFSEMGSSCPSQNIHPAGAKFPPNMRISPTYGCAMDHPSSIRAVGLRGNVRSALVVVRRVDDDLLAFRGRRCVRAGAIAVLADSHARDVNLHAGLELDDARGARPEKQLEEAC